MIIYKVNNTIEVYSLYGEVVVLRSLYGTKLLKHDICSLKTNLSTNNENFNLLKEVLSVLLFLSDITQPFYQMI